MLRIGTHESKCYDESNKLISDPFKSLFSWLQIAQHGVDNFHFYLRCMKIEISSLLPTIYWSDEEEKLE